MPFTRLMGLVVTSQEKDRIVGNISVREDLCTTGKIMHGGAVMAMADALGAIGAYLNIPEGAKATTTIESKTNFMRAAPRCMSGEEPQFGKPPYATKNIKR